ncbi:MAG: hypothetical protein ACRC8Y_01390 [Chroococcales cyanobacterium]
MGIEGSEADKSSFLRLRAPPVPSPWQGEGTGKDLKCSDRPWDKVLPCPPLTGMADRLSMKPQLEQRRAKFFGVVLPDRH